MSVAVALANASVAPVDVELGTLVAGDFPGTVYRLLLRMVNGRSPLASFRLHCPPSRMGNDMLSTMGHDYSLLQSMMPVALCEPLVV
jgi:hypothetical protein